MPILLQSAVPPPAVAEYRVLDRTTPHSECNEPTGGEVVVCGRANTEAYRLRPPPPLAKQPGFLERPHVIHLAPGVGVGLLGNGHGVGLRASF